MGINLIVARSHAGIGKDGDKTPWEKIFRKRKLTKENVVIMDHGTYEMLGSPLSDRFNIVVSGITDIGNGNIVTVKSLNEGIGLAKGLGYDGKEIFVIAGDTLYEEAANAAIDRIYVIEADSIHSSGAVKAFKLFPQFDYSTFEYTEDEWQEDGDYKYRRALYVRRPMKGTVFHKYINVNSDEQKKESFIGSLADFASRKLSEWRQQNEPDARVVSIESCSWTERMHPKENNSATWYDRRILQLSVWLERQ